MLTIKVKNHILLRIKIKGRKIMNITGNIVDVLNSKIFYGELRIDGSIITEIIENGPERPYEKKYIIPGFIDSHIHIESSMLTPSEFARIALNHGTLATVSDAHEIANVSGLAGVKFMIENAARSPLKFYFSAPSCVPFEAGSGFSIAPCDVDELMKQKTVNHLGEVMNVQGILNGDSELYEKIALTKKYAKIIDGHAPGLSGEALKKYAAAGISTDHECTSEAEAREKLGAGIKIQIREGSAAKDFESLYPIIADNYKNCMFASDDRHPEDLLHGHINLLVKKAVKKGVDPIKALYSASASPILHYKLDLGLLRKGDNADFLIVNDLCDFDISGVYAGGKLVSDGKSSFTDSERASFEYVFNASEKKPADFKVPARGTKIRVIEAIDGKLITKSVIADAKIVNGFVESDIENDILKLALISRYKDIPPVIGFIKNTGLKYGAIASSVNHDAHNIIVLGTSDEALAKAANLVIKSRGGISAVSNCGDSDVLPLAIGGIISDMPCEHVAEKYDRIDRLVFDNIKTTLSAPFMTLSFMSLFVIPSLKMSSTGLFDADNFKPVDLFV